MSNKEKIPFEVVVVGCHGKRISLGKYETYKENHVLCIDVPDSVSKIRAIHLDFPAKDPQPNLP